MATNHRIRAGFRHCLVGNGDDGQAESRGHELQSTTSRLRIRHLGDTNTKYDRYLSGTTVPGGPSIYSVSMKPRITMA